SERGLVSVRWDGTDLKSYINVEGITVYGSDYNDQHLLSDAPTAPEKKPSKASVLLKAPKGNYALAQINNDIYVVTVPYIGAEPTLINVSDPADAAFPAMKLTEIGGQFPSWSADGQTVYWSIGNAFFTYHIPMALAQKKAAQKNKSEKDEKEELPSYEAKEMRVRVSTKRDIPKGSYLLTNATLITMEGDEIIENGAIWVENNRIKRVGTMASITLPEDVHQMDMSGKYILPGFVDTHAHMWPAWELHKNENWMYAANLAYGVTTTRDPQTGTTDVLTYADRVTAGTLTGPRIYSTGPGVGFWGYNIKSLEHARNVLKQYSEYYNTKTIKMYLTGNRKHRQWIIQAAKEQKLMPTTEGGLDFKLNLTQILDGYPGHEHSFPVYPLYDDFISFVAQSQTAYTPTLLVSYGGPWAENYYYATENVQYDPKLNRFTPKSELDAKSRRRNAGWFMKEEHVFDDHAVFVKDLVEAGGIAGVGSHGQLQGLGYHWELWSMQAGGISPHNALRIATHLGAKAIGLAKDLGSIKPGKLADLIVLDKNPIENIRHSNSLHYVIKNGRVYEAETLDEVYPNPKKFGVKTWQEAVPENLPGISAE
ncbi:MAG: amidohydrolase family protein, partial [Flavobacteriaceae bacterium]